MERRCLRLETRQLPELHEPITVHRTERSDRGPNGSMLFSHGTVQHLKRTAEVNGSRVFRSDRTVWSGLKFHVFYLTLHFSTFLFFFFFFFLLFIHTLRPKQFNYFFPQFLFYLKNWAKMAKYHLWPNNLCSTIVYEIFNDLPLF